MVSVNLGLVKAFLELPLLLRNKAQSLEVIVSDKEDTDFTVVTLVRCQ